VQAVSDGVVVSDETRTRLPAGTYCVHCFSRSLVVDNCDDSTKQRHLSFWKIVSNVALSLGDKESRRTQSHSMTMLIISSNHRRPRRMSWRLTWRRTIQTMRRSGIRYFIVHVRQLALVLLCNRQLTRHMDHGIGRPGLPHDTLTLVERLLILASLCPHDDVRVNCNICPVESIRRSTEVWQ
jgi:hypothetical protein